MNQNLTCRDMMLENQAILHPNDSVGKAFLLMRDQGMRFLPVVEEDGTYKGVFTSPTLIRLLLPQAATIDLGGKNVHKGLTDLSFLNLGVENFKDSLRAVKNDVVSNHLSESKNIPKTHADTPIMEGILLLHQYKRYVILLENDADNDLEKYVGVLSNNSTLRTLFDESFVL